MIKFKNIIIFFLIAFFFNNCGYTPKYSKNKNVNFSLEIISLSGDREFNNSLKSKLSQYTDNKKSEIKNYEVSINSDYKKDIILKNSSGIATEYELRITVIFQINDNNVEKNYKIIETFNMKKMDDTFEESNYERSIKENFANIIQRKLIFYLLEM
tara:strand:+ start:1908 stop:2375 length:468 start_codon:yes stop_codon:yes gene_type:complete